MSDIGLNASIYNITSDYFDLLNQYALAIEKDDKNIDPKLTISIKNFFEVIINNENDEPQVYMIATVIERAFRNQNKNIEALAKQVLIDLEDQTPSNSTREVLEQILKALDSERVRAFTRMKSSAR
ncbi:MAG: hypothetical protein F6K11_28010 [Leptolyngbya sp. SIO3F4]|nr:hypothetical protein [Leptolyngbya sp. SIO3F4]